MGDGGRIGRGRLLGGEVNKNGGEPRVKGIGPIEGRLNPHRREEGQNEEERLKTSFHQPRSQIFEREGREERHKQKTFGVVNGGDINSLDVLGGKKHIGRGGRGLRGKIIHGGHSE